MLYPLSGEANRLLCGTDMFILFSRLLELPVPDNCRFFFFAHHVQYISRQQFRQHRDDQIDVKRFTDKNLAA